MGLINQRLIEIDGRPRVRPRIILILFGYFENNTASLICVPQLKSSPLAGRPESTHAQTQPNNYTHNLIVPSRLLAGDIYWTHRPPSTHRLPCIAAVNQTAILSQLHSMLLLKNMDK